MKQIKEKWETINNTNGLYQISNLGKVKRTSIKPKTKDGIMKISLSGEYPSVGITVNGKRDTIHIHRLIAKAFIPNPQNKPCVNHINGIKHDNRIENLEWVTHSENVNHSHHVLGSKSCKKINQLTLNGVFIKQWDSIKMAGKFLNKHPDSISKACMLNNGHNKALGFRWEYVNNNNL